MRERRACFQHAELPRAISTREYSRPSFARGPRSQRTHGSGQTTLAVGVRVAVVVVVEGRVGSSVGVSMSKVPYRHPFPSWIRPLSIMASAQLLCSSEVLLPLRLRHRLPAGRDRPDPRLLRGERRRIMWIRL